MDRSNEKVIKAVCGLFTGLILITSLVSRTDAQNNPGYVVSYGNSTFPISCCYIETACSSCSNVYKVNSITYCCPNCRGQVIVTDLVCACYPPANTDISGYNCTLSNTIVGGYIAWRPSYYYSRATAIGASSLTAVILGIFAWWLATVRR